MHHPMSSGEVTELLHQLSRNVNADNQWEDRSQIQDMMVVTPDCQFAWLFRIEPMDNIFPSNVNKNAYAKCHLHIQNVSTCRTVSECLQGYHITIDKWSSFVVLNNKGEFIDPATAPVQAVILKSKT